jgi:hypothetical protein
MNLMLCCVQGCARCCAAATAPTAAGPATARRAGRGRSVSCRSPSAGTWPAAVMGTVGRPGYAPATRDGPAATANRVSS